VPYVDLSPSRQDRAKPLRPRPPPCPPRWPLFVVDDLSSFAACTRLNRSSVLAARAWALQVAAFITDLGNTVFLDANLEPHPDQWDFLLAARRMSRDDVETIAAEAARKGLVVGVRPPDDGDDDLATDPWRSKPSPGTANRRLSGPLPALAPLHGPHPASSGRISLSACNLPEARGDALLLHARPGLTGSSPGDAAARSR